LFVHFSSRRRNTNSSRDWSSDVCSSALDDLQPSWPHGPPIWHPDCIPAPPQPFPHYFRVPYFNLDSQSEVSMRSLIPMKRTGRAIVIAVLAANVVACGSWSRTQRGAAIGGAGGAANG